MAKKSIVKNYIYNIIYNLLNILFPIITLSYVSKILFADGVGKVAFAANIVSYFLVISQLGIPRYGPREIATQRDDREKVSKAFWEIFITNFISTTIMIILYYSVINNKMIPFQEIALMNIFGLMLFFNLFNVDWFYTGIEEYKYITIRSIISKIISIIALFIFVKEKEDYIWYGLIQCCGTGINYFFNIINLRKFILRPKLKELCLKKHLKSIILLFSMTLAVELYSQLDTTMLGIMCGNKEVGYYTNSIKMTKMIVIVITSLSTVLLPRLSWYYENKENKKINEIVDFALKFVVFLAFPACCGIIVVSKPIILTMYGIDFSESILTFKLLATLIPIMSIGNLFGTQILVVFRKEKELLFSVIIGAVINMILNTILISLFRHNGAVIATIIAEFCVMIAQYIFARKYIVLNFKLKELVQILIGSITIFIVSILKYFISNLVLLMIVQILCGILLYILIEVLFKNKILYDILGFIKRK